MDANSDWDLELWLTKNCKSPPTNTEKWFSWINVKDLIRSAIAQDRKERIQKEWANETKEYVPVWLKTCPLEEKALASQFWWYAKDLILRDRKEREIEWFCKQCGHPNPIPANLPDPLSARLERLRDIYEQRGYSGHSVNLQSRPTYAPRPYRCWWLVETDNEEEEEDIIYEGLTPLAAVERALEEAE